ncbi:MAG: hypothetical protein RI883_160 [Bacteroidota bacterium]|jgi:hypothetical protein
MENNIINENPLQVFIIITETLTGWKSPTTDIGKAVLMKHYEWAFKDPFHTNGFRRNVVHSMKITMTENTLFMPLKKLID